MPPNEPDSLSTALTRNIEAMEQRRLREAAAATRHERIVEAITAFMGSMPFVYLHLALYGAWILINLGVVRGLPKFDPTFVALAVAASLEALFLSTFVLISQNRLSAAETKRADLDLQISLLTEHELTKLTEMVEEIAKHFDIKTASHPELDEIKKNIVPEAVLDEIEAQQRRK
ncbi:MAG: hypothetical protein JWQ55_6162 [Rhodopila sp.]|jgi:uncharacterized membrane protein|nr:hypothetical protein [Rhodopila sp.]